MNPTRIRSLFLAGGLLSAAGAVGLLCLVVPPLIASAQPAAGSVAVLADEGVAVLADDLDAGELDVGSGEPAPVAATSASSAAPSVTPGTAAPAAVPDVTDAQALRHAADAVRQFDGASSLNGAAKRKAIFGGLTALFWFLIWFSRKVAPRWVNDQVCRAAAAALFVATLLTSAVALGQPFWQSVDVALAGPAALALQELRKVPSPARWLKAKEKAKAQAAARPAPAPGPQS